MTWEDEIKAASRAELERLIGAETTLRKTVESALVDIHAEIAHGATANWDYIEKRFREAFHASGRN